MRRVLVLLGAALVVATPAAAELPAWSAGELVRLETPQRVVALTFDAGSSDVGARSILATLEREDVPATFFFTGRFVDRYPVLARRIGEDYVVGNHTATHPHLTRLGDAAVRAEIVRAQARILARTGRDPRPLFRFPYGDRDARTIRISRQLGYVPIRWSVDSLGWMGVSRSTILARVTRALVPGEIVLMHVGETADARALPAVIAALRSRGYTFVTLSSVRAA